VPGLDPDRLSLGCHQLFHIGVSGGYRLGEGWTVLLTWEHLSNAGLCVRNQGINNVGAKIGFAF
jgi:lipid A 3-O-deacylase